MRTIDLWEDSAGRLYLTDRDARTGYCGFEVARDKLTWRAPDRTILHFMADAEDYGQLADSEFMTPMEPDAVAMLYVLQPDVINVALVAGWVDGVCQLSGNPYVDAARWYLGRVGR